MSGLQLRNNNEVSNSSENAWALIRNLAPKLNVESGMPHYKKKKLKKKDCFLINLKSEHTIFKNITMWLELLKGFMYTSDENYQYIKQLPTQRSNHTPFFPL